MEWGILAYPSYAIIKVFWLAINTIDLKEYSFTSI